MASQETIGSTEDLDDFLSTLTGNPMVEQFAALKMTVGNMDPAPAAVSALKDYGAMLRHALAVALGDGLLLVVFADGTYSLDPPAGSGPY